METSLVIMAAGIGSRYGSGIKQLEPLGPSGELIMDYSIYDALEAGFQKVVFVIRREMEAYFRRMVGDRTERKAKVAYAFQELSDLPQGFTPGERTKPWGTGQAVLACRDIVREPFVVLNADDYYGKEAFRQIHTFLTHPKAGEEPFRFCMAGFRLQNTLSDHGGVTRGLCSLNPDGSLCHVNETQGIEKIHDRPAIRREDDVHFLDGKTYCSMNIWGMTPDFFPYLENGFCDFLRALPSGDLKSEYLLPNIVDDMLRKGDVRVDVLESNDKWFGVTYQEDKESVRTAFRALADSGAYPEDIR